MDNIKLFDLYSSYIFDKIYSSFPKCITINNVDEEIQNIDEKFSDEFQKYNIQIEPSEKNIIFSETMLWLTNNGFIDFKTSYPDSKRPAYPLEYSNFMCISLTLKGLNLLTSPKPKSLNKSKKLGEEIAEKVKQGSLLEAGKMLTENMFDFIIEKGLK